jgi:tRNA (guanine37-N1)-methyltransferase
VKFDIVTIFPAMVNGPLAEGVVGRAVTAGLLDVAVHDLRDYTTDRHRVVDDVPFGGGPGMVLKPEPLFRAVEHIRESRGAPGAVVLTSPDGPRFTHREAARLRGMDHVVILCGRYEGVDERVMPYLDGELSLGDFILTGGEVAALAVVDAVARLLPGVLGNVDSSVSESFEEGLLEYPHYTRPPAFRGAEVPAILQSGDHARIARWRRWKALQLTRERRPELFARLELGPADQKLLAKREEEL